MHKELGNNKLNFMHSCFQNDKYHFLNLAYLSGHIGGSKGNNHARLDDTSLNTTHRDRANATNFVDVLEWETQGLVCGAGRGEDGIQSVDQGLAAGIALLALNRPSLRVNREIN